MAEAGHRYLVYDTGKIVNILFQLDGHALWHFDHPQLVHIGGLLALHLAAGRRCEERRGRDTVVGGFGGMEARLTVARYSAAVLRGTIERRPVPPLPPDLDPPMQARL